MSITTPTGYPASKKRRDKSQYLYMAVIGAVALGIVVGLVVPNFAIKLAPLGSGFVSLITMMIQPIVFCTIVLGVGSVASAARIGKIGGLALGYFTALSLVALVIGLVVGNLLHPGQGLQLTTAIAEQGQAKAAGGSPSTQEFLLGIIPTSLLSGLTSGDVLQTLFVALLVGFALHSARGPPDVAGNCGWPWLGRQ